MTPDSSPPSQPNNGSDEGPRITIRALGAEAEFKVTFNWLKRLFPRFFRKPIRVLVQPAGAWLRVSLEREDEGEITGEIYFANFYPKDLIVRSLQINTVNIGNTQLRCVSTNVNVNGDPSLKPQKISAVYFLIPLNLKQVRNILLTMCVR